MVSPPGTNFPAPAQATRTWLRIKRSPYQLPTSTSTMRFGKPPHGNTTDDAPTLAVPLTTNGLADTLEGTSGKPITILPIARPKKSFAQHSPPVSACYTISPLPELQQLLTETTQSLVRLWAHPFCKQGSSNLDLMLKYSFNPAQHCTCRNKSLDPQAGPFPRCTFKIAKLYRSLHSKPPSRSTIKELRWFLGILHVRYHSFPSTRHIPHHVRCGKAD